MDDFTDIRGMLAHSVSRYVKEQYSFEQRRSFVGSSDGFSKEHWGTYAELGWLMLPISQEFGGFGGSAADTHILMHEFGRGNVLSPYLSCVIVASEIIQSAAPMPTKQSALDEVGSGQAIYAFLTSERHSGYDSSHIATTAKKDSDGYLLNGEKIAVAYGNVADRLIVAARTAGGTTDRHGLSLFVLPTAAKGISRTDYVTHDGGRVSTMRFDNAQATLIGAENEAIELIERVNNRAAASICAEMTGAMWALCASTLDYLKTRSQFGSKIGSFQALQHRMVDFYMKCELAHSLGLDAARAIDELQGVEQDVLVSAAKWQVGETAVHVAEEAVHLHGAMGMMDELPIGHYLKRITVLNQQYGNAMHHQARYRRLTNDRKSL